MSILKITSVLTLITSAMKLKLVSKIQSTPWGSSTLNSGMKTWTGVRLSSKSVTLHQEVSLNLQVLSTSDSSRKPLITQPWALSK